MVETEIGKIEVKMLSDTSLAIHANDLTINKVGFKMSVTCIFYGGQVIGTPEEMNTLRHDWEKHKYRQKLSKESAAKVFNIIKTRLENRIATDPNFLRKLKADMLSTRRHELLHTLEELRVSVDNSEKDLRAVENELNTLQV